MILLGDQHGVSSRQRLPGLCREYLVWTDSGVSTSRAVVSVPLSVHRSVTTWQHVWARLGIRRIKFPGSSLDRNARGVTSLSQPILSSRPRPGRFACGTCTAASQRC